jgi:tRNA(fMet)-specific endonuclease VapC
MSLVLLDTSILVHVSRNDGLGKRVIADHSLTTRTDKPLISVVTIGELLAFARKRNWGRPKVDHLKEMLRQLVVVDINSSDVLEKYAEIDAWCHVNGRSLSKNDLWIAATTSIATSHLLTTDQDFDPLNGTFLNRTYYDPAATYT